MPHESLILVAFGCNFCQIQLMLPFSYGVYKRGSRGGKSGSSEINAHLLFLEDTDPSEPQEKTTLILHCSCFPHVQGRDRQIMSTTFRPMGPFRGKAGLDVCLILHQKAATIRQGQRTFISTIIPNRSPSILYTSLTSL